jgi:phosphoribosylamine--glycine ligase
LRILIVGSGGREHALAWKLIQSPQVNKIFAAPGNGGTAMIAENLPVADDDIPALVDLAREKQIDLVVPGPELPLVLGLKEALEREGVACFGPDAFTAQLEGSKAFAKTVMVEAGVPTAAFEVFDDHDEAAAHVREREEPMVVKADGLAAGKGVIVCKTRDEALQALNRIMLKKEFGDAAGERVVVEDALIGEEASFLAFCDGDDVLLMPSSQDHKPVGEGDTGPNTGGMGAYSPAPILPEADYESTANLVIRPIVRAMADSGHPYAGVLYAGLMYTADGPKVLEYNVRFGDPECQPLLMRLDGDLAEIMLACVDGRLNEVEAKWKPETSICVVMASGGYPGSYVKGKEISGLDEAEDLPGVTVFQAGTKIQDGKIVSSGGRVLGVTALGRDLRAARDQAYQAVDRITFENSYFRRDIGDKGLTRRTT